MPLLFILFQIIRILSDGLGVNYEYSYQTGESEIQAIPGGQGQQLSKVSG